MRFDRREVLTLGLLAVAGCTATSAPGAAPAPSNSPGGTAVATGGATTGSSPAGTSPPATAPPSPTTTPPATVRKVPAPRFALATAPGGGIDGDALDRRLAALGPYRGGTLRKIVVRPGTYSRTRPLRLPSGVHLVAAGATFVSRIPGAQDPLVDISNVSDVTVEGGTWDGNANKIKVVTEWKHNFRIHNSSRVTLKGLLAQNAKGDGIYLGSFRTPCRDITVTSVKSRKNYRNGMSITSCDGLRCTDSIFNDNGETSPLAGVDVEPHDAAAPIRDLRFSRCAFSSNTARGFLVVMHPGNVERPGAIRLADCTIEKNGRAASSSLWAGISLIRPRGVEISNCLLRENHVGIAIQSRRPSDAKSMLGQGIVTIDRVDVVDSEREGMIVLKGIRKLEVNDARLLNSSREQNGFFSGILLAGGSNMTFTDCVSEGARRFGLQAAPSVRRVVLTRCRLAGNTAGELDVPKAGVRVVR